MTIRPAVVTDADALIDFWRVAAENDNRPVDTPEAVLAVIARDPDACLIAEREGQIVGTVIAGWDGWRAHVYRLAVAPQLRRRGIGSRLLRSAEARLAALGARRVEAMVLDSNERGQVVWTAAGYSPQADWTRWVRPVP